MSKTNCKNCGGPLNIAEPKCPFCGTKNINLTDIDLASGEAANFIFRLPHNIKGIDDGEVYMSMLAIPELTAIEMKSDYIEVYGGWNNASLVKYQTNNALEMNLNLRAVPRANTNEICCLTYK